MNESTWLYVIIGCEAVLAMLFFAMAYALAKELTRRKRESNNWQDRYQDEHDRLRDWRDRAHTWESRYELLQKEYDELAELDEGEDYVRESLGYPPDEDNEESA